MVAMPVFSTDNGRTWTDPTCVDATPYSGFHLELNSSRLGFMLKPATK